VVRTPVEKGIMTEWKLYGTFETCFKAKEESKYRYSDARNFLYFSWYWLFRDKESIKL